MLRKFGRPPRKRGAKSREDYVRLKCAYVAKRKKIRDKYKYGDPAYKVEVERVSRRLDCYNRAIKKYDLQYSKLSEINNKIKDHYGFSLYLSTHHWGNLVKGSSEQMVKKVLVRRMFCKYSIEKGIGNHYICAFLGKKDNGAGLAPRYRGELNKLIKSNEDILKKWHKFKTVMNDEGEAKPEKVS